MDFRCGTDQEEYPSNKIKIPVIIANYELPFNLSDNNLSFSHGGFSKKKNILNEQAIKTTMKPRLDKEPLMLVVSLTKYIVSPNFV